MTAQERLEYSHEPYRQELVDGILYRRTKVEAKARDWIAAGTRAVVVADPPSRTVTVLGHDDVRVLHGEETIDLGDVVPGWSPRVADLFV